jgi:hypothetical protein
MEAVAQPNAVRPTAKAKAPKKRGPKGPHSGQFKKGNTASRSVGGHRMKTKILQVLGADAINDLIKKEAEIAKGDDTVALNAREFLLARILPPLKATHEKSSFSLDLTDLQTASASILNAVAEGKLAPDIGETLSRTLASTAQVGQISALTQRLNDLENKIADQSPAPVTIPAPNFLDATPDPELITSAKPSWLRDKATDGVVIDQEPDQKQDEA